MRFEIEAEHKELLDQIQEFCRGELNIGASDRDETRSFARKEWTSCGSFGLPGLLVPQEFGGRGVDFVSTVACLHALGYWSQDNGFSFALGAHLLGCVAPVWMFGTTSQHHELLPFLSNGQWIAGNAITESEAGSDVFRMETTASHSDSSYIISGTKAYCANAPVADIIVLYALTDEASGALGGITSFVARQGQFRVGAPILTMGLRSCLASAVHFDAVKVGSDALIGRRGKGAHQFHKIMKLERIGLSAINLGILERLFESVVLHCKRRIVRGKTLMGRQAVAHRLADIKTELSAARLLVYHAARAVGVGGGDVEASMVKLYISEKLRQRSMDILHLYGSEGFRSGSEAERAVRDAAAAGLYSGTSEIQRNLIASSL